MVRNDIKNSSLLKTKFLIYAFNGRTIFASVNPYHIILSKGTSPYLIFKKSLFALKDCTYFYRFSLF